MAITRDDRGFDPKQSGRSCCFFNEVQDFVGGNRNEGQSAKVHMMLCIVCPCENISSRLGNMYPTSTGVITEDNAVTKMGCFPGVRYQYMEVRHFFF